MEGTFQTIRKHDKSTPIIQYQYHGVGAQEVYYPLFKQYNVTATTGGVEEEPYQRYVSVYGLWGIRSRGEPNPAQGTNWGHLNAGMAAMLAYGGLGANYSIQWHTAYPEPQRAPAAADAIADADFKRWNTILSGWLSLVKKINVAPDFHRWAQILPELGDARPLPVEAGALYSHDRARYVYRSQHPALISGSAISRAWNEKTHRLPQWITDYTPVELYKGLKLLV